MWRNSPLRARACKPTAVLSSTCPQIEANNLSARLELFRAFRERLYKLELTEDPRFNCPLVGLGGLWVTCSPRDPRFPGEVDGFFRK